MSKYFETSKLATLVGEEGNHYTQECKESTVILSVTTNGKDLYVHKLRDNADLGKPTTKIIHVKVFTSKRYKGETPISVSSEDLEGYIYFNTVEREKRFEQIFIKIEDK